jgi:formamidopyrimidine-DNA glycosylase
MGSLLESTQPSTGDYPRDVPELPDLLYIQSELDDKVRGRVVDAARLENPVLLRALVEGDLSLLVGKKLSTIERLAHFLVFGFSGGLELAINPMLAGRFRIAERGERDEAALGFALGFGEVELRYLDDKQMGKVYLLKQEQRGAIPALPKPGLPILGKEFTREAFRAAIAKRRDQVRVFIMDKNAIDSLGNAYADEVLWAARLHPKTPCRALSPDEVDRLHDEMARVMRAAVEEVATRKAPTEEKIRDFLQIRLREVCPRCGHKVRKAGVYGKDSYFCPHCQPAKRQGLVDWRKTGK